MLQQQRLSGRDCRNPDHKDVFGARHPWHLIGVGKAINLPSLRTVRAVFPHTALQSRISSSGLTSYTMSLFHGEKPKVSKIRIWHQLT